MAGFAIYVVLVLTFASLSIAAGDNLNELVGLVMGASLAVGSVFNFIPGMLMPLNKTSHAD